MAINVTRRRLRNIVILVSSLVFYFWASGALVWLLIFSIGFNWAWALILSKRRTKLVLAIGVVTNISLLVFFKYSFFLAQNFDYLLASKSADTFSAIILPIGISFYTFQSMSYLIDVWRGDAEPDRDPIRYGAYLSFFPQLIAGPIVRYSDVMKDFKHPQRDLSLVSSGCVRFAHGLAKKVVVADTAGAIADVCFAQSGADLTAGVSWLGAIAYTIQIYFDFSGYSDMAIGIGRICGIRLHENFLHPYTSSTITEFWRRWHISLSSWFRDYLYIPLGGSRVSDLKVYRNLFIVFLVTGLWHGASWTFVIWGLYHGTFLTIERVLTKGRAISIGSEEMRFFYALPVVICGWVVFRAETISVATTYFAAMLSVFTPGAWSLPIPVLDLLTPLSVAVLLIGSTSFFMRREPSIGEWIGADSNVAGEIIKLVYLTALLWIACLFALAQDFSPFLYFRF